LLRLSSFSRPPLLVDANHPFTIIKRTFGTALGTPLGKFALAALVAAAGVFGAFAYAAYGGGTIGFSIVPGSKDTLSQGLVGWWTMDSQDTNWATGQETDKSGNGNTGQLVNMSTTTSPVEGKIGGALKFNGINNYALVPDVASLRVSTHFTISFWMKSATPNPPQTYIICRCHVGGVGQTALIYGYVASTVEFYATGFTGSDPRTGSQITVNDTFWHHIVYDYDGTTWSGYKDGVQIFSTARTFSLSTIALDGWYMGVSDPPSTTAGTRFFAAIAGVIRSVLWMRMKLYQSA
jgi:Concanavalin A-like lectin/glucanases superfamily